MFVRIKLQSFDHKILEEMIKKIVQVVIKSGGKVVGPIPLTTIKKTFSLRRATFVFSKHSDKIQSRIHRRLMDIHQVTPEVINNLSNLAMPAGVEIAIETVNAV